jgi:hypothetical protein
VFISSVGDAIELTSALVEIDLFVNHCGYGPILLVVEAQNLEEFFRDK